MAKIGVVADDFTGTASSGMMMAKAQVELLEKSEISVEHISVSPKSLLKGGEEARSEVKRVVEKARKIFDLDHTPEAVLIETALHDSVVNLKEEDEKQNLPFGSCSDRINAGLAEITNEILEKCARDKISGMMVIPLLLGSLLITIFPNIFDIGGLTAAVFSSAATNTLLGAQLFCMGTALKVRDMPKVLKRGGVLLLAKFVIGTGINLANVVKGGFPGILLGLITVFVGGAFILFCDRFISRRLGYAAWAVSTTAGNAVAVPAAIALIDTAWEPYVSTVTVQVAASVVVSCILAPILTSWWAKRHGCPKMPLEGQKF